MDKPTKIVSKDKVTQKEVDLLIDKHGFDMELIKKQFDVIKEPTQRNYEFKVEHERQYAIKVLNVISNLKQRERERVLQRASLLNKV
tara:strand:- start:885 stop:1145 length:261 start_codon:yes stop_codon:yes gene_type:complete